MIVLCILRNAFHELFCIFGDFYVSGMQNAEVTKSLIRALFCESRIFALLKIKSWLWENKMCSGFFKILYQTCISFSLFLSSSSIVVREATISSTLVPTFVSSMNNNTSCKVNLVFFSSTATNDCQVARNLTSFPGPSLIPWSKRERSLGMRLQTHLLHCFQHLSKFHHLWENSFSVRYQLKKNIVTQTKSVEYTKTERKLSLVSANRLYSLQVLFFILFVILMRRKCLKTKATINPLLSPALK